MSFIEQERAMFDLLFDTELRAAFLMHEGEALSDYELTASEKRDLEMMRKDSLELEASMRTSMILSYLCKSYPLSCSIISSFIDGTDMMKTVVNPDLMRADPAERAVLFGKKLSENLGSFPFDLSETLTLTTCCLGLEFHMAQTGSNLKKEILQHKHSTDISAQQNDNWASLPISLSDHVCAVALPLPYQTMQQVLCPVPAAEIWRYRVSNPLPEAEVLALAEQQQPTLLVARHLEWIHPAL